MHFSNIAPGTFVGPEDTVTVTFTYAKYAANVQLEDIMTKLVVHEAVCRSIADKRESLRNMLNICNTIDHEYVRFLCRDLHRLRTAKRALMHD